MYEMNSRATRDLCRRLLILMCTKSANNIPADIL